MSVNVADLVATLRADTSQFQMSIGSALSDLSKYVASASLASVATAGLTLAIAAAAKEFLEFAYASSRAAGQYAESLERIKTVTGLSVSAIQDMGVVLNTVGMDVNSLSMMYRRLSGNLDAAKNGAAAATEKFEELGITISQSDTAESTIRQIADAYSAMTDETKRAASAIDLLGRSGQAMLPFLVQGIKAFDDAAAAAAHMGKLTNEQVATLSRMDDAFDNLGMAAKMFKDQIGAAFAPAFEAAAKGLTEAVAFLTRWFMKASLAATDLVNHIVMVGKLLAEMPMAIGELFASIKTGTLDEAWAAHKVREKAILDEHDAVTKLLQADHDAVGSLKLYGDATNEATAQIKKRSEALKAAGDAQESLGRKQLRADVIKNREAELTHGPQRIKQAVELSGLYRTTITPDMMQKEEDKGNAELRRSLLQRARDIETYGQPFITAMEKQGQIFGTVFSLNEGMAEQDKTNEMLRGWLTLRATLIETYGAELVNRAERINAEFGEALGPGDLEAEVERGNAIQKQLLLDRALLVEEFGERTISSMEEINSRFGLALTPTEMGIQEDAGKTISQSYQEQQRVLSVLTAQEQSHTQAVLAMAQAQYQAQSGAFRDVETVRAASSAAIQASYQRDLRAIQEAYDAGTVSAELAEQQRTDTLLRAEAQRMGIARQFPTFWEQQLNDMIASNAFSMATITSSFNQSIASMVVNGGKLTQFYKQLGVTGISAVMQVAEQAIAQAIKSSLETISVKAGEESAKTALAVSGASTRTAIAAAEGAQTTSILGGIQATAQGMVGAMGNALIQLGQFAVMVLQQIASGIFTVLNAIASALMATGILAPIGIALKAVSAGMMLSVSASLGDLSAFLGGADLGWMSNIREMLTGTSAAYEMGGATVIEGTEGVASSIPWDAVDVGMASGGIIERPTIVGMGEAGPEAVIPLNAQGSAFMQDTFGMTAKPTQQTIIIELDGKQLTKFVVNGLPSSLRAKGLLT